DESASSRRWLARMRPTRFPIPRTAPRAVSSLCRRNLAALRKRHDRIAHRCEAKVGHQLSELSRRAAQSAVVSQSRQPRYGDARLRGVDFPGMDIERAGHVTSLALAQRGLHDAVR